jgi:hypothetical protein
MKSDIWGPPAWFFLHSVTLQYPINPTAQDKTNMMTFLTSLGNVLPCEKCQMHYKKNLQELPLNNTVLGSRNNLVNWMIDIHNLVNKSNGKRELSHEEAIKLVQDKYHEDKSSNLIIYIFIMLFIIGLLVVLVWVIINKN